MICARLLSFGLPTQSEKCSICGKTIKESIDAYFLLWDERDDEYVKKVLNLRNDVEILLICENCLWDEIRNNIKRKVKICIGEKTIGMFINGRYVDLGA
ncbi:MAG: hypothetical protein ACP6IS_08195 [Candidatus Asgardarchaeia archaeon]